MPVNIFNNFYFRNLLAILLILAGYALYIVPQLLNIGGIRGFCFFHEFTGIPCPGCGMGRASVLLSQGMLWESFITHPLAIPFAIGALTAISWLVADLLRKKETLLPLMKAKLGWPYFLILLIIVLTVWARNILLQI